MAIPLSIEPSDGWIDLFRTSLLLPPGWSLDFDDQEMILDGPMTDIESVMNSISDAVDAANNPTATTQTGLDGWWDSRNPSQVEAEAPTFSAPASDVTSDAAPPSTSDEPSSAAILGWSLGSGILSIFFGGEFGLIPIVTVVVSLIAVMTRAGHRRVWQGWVGLALGGVYTLVYLNNYGYL